MNDVLGVTAAVVLALALSACGGGKCDKAQAAYLAEQSARAESALSSPAVDETVKPKLRAQADRELDHAKAEFSNACKDLGDFELACFEDANRRKDPSCKDVRGKLDKALWSNFH